MGDDGPESSRGRRSKVARLVDEYDLAEIGDDLERKWTAAGAERWSLRDLADEFNTALLRNRLSDADVVPLDEEVDALYRTLTSADATSADRTRARRRLERDGVDVDALLDDFVSYQAIRTYLQNYRGATYDASDTDPVAGTQSTVRRLQSRLISVTESRLERLDAEGAIDIDSPSVLTDVNVVCEECGRQFDIDELEAGVTCDCRRS